MNKMMLKITARILVDSSIYISVLLFYGKRAEMIDMQNNTAFEKSIPVYSIIFWSDLFTNPVRKTPLSTARLDRRYLPCYSNITYFPGIFVLTIDSQQERMFLAQLDYG